MTLLPALFIDNVVSILRKALPVHWKNRSEIEYLWHYYKGRQPVLNREKQVRPEICNKIVENRANEIVSFKSGYLMGEPLQYVSRGNAERRYQRGCSLLWAGFEAVRMIICGF